MIVRLPPSSRLRGGAEKVPWAGTRRRDQNRRVRGAPARGDHQVVRACEAGDRVEHQHDIFAPLDEAFWRAAAPSRATRVWFSTTSSKGRSKHLGFDRPVHVGHLFRTLADENDHQMGSGIVLADAVGDLLENGRLAGFGRRDDQPALPTADRRQHVQQPGGQDVGFGFQRVLLVGKDRRQLVEIRPGLGRLRIQGRSPPQPAKDRNTFRFPWGGRTWPITMSPVLRPKRRIWDWGHVHVFRPGQQMVRAQKADTVLDDLQNATAENEAFAFCFGAQQPENQVRFFFKRV